MTIQSRHWHLRASFLLALLLVISPLIPTVAKAQGMDASERTTSEENDPSVALSQIMRLERVDVPGGAELITVFARLGGIESTENDKWIPLVSILRDTLGDNNAENNRLRYVWPLMVTATLGLRPAARAVITSSGTTKPVAVLELWRSVVRNFTAARVPQWR